MGQKQLYNAWLSNYNPQYSVGCNYLSIPYITYSGMQVLISQLSRIWWHTLVNRTGSFFKWFLSFFFTTACLFDTKTLTESTLHVLTQNRMQCSSMGMHLIPVIKLYFKITVWTWPSFSQGPMNKSSRLYNFLTEKMEIASSEIT